MSEDNTNSNSNSMNTSELARALSKSQTGQNLGLTQARSLAVLQTITNIVSGELAAGHDVRIHQFGIFKVLETQARKGRNPRTGEEIDIEAGKRVHFVVAQNVKDAARTGTAPTLDIKIPEASTRGKGSGKSSSKGKAKATAATPGNFKPSNESSDEL